MNETKTLQLCSPGSLTAYLSNTRVHAAKIAGITFNHELNNFRLLFEAPAGTPQGFQDITPEWKTRFGPEAGGYFITYDDGYCPYSPAKAFEEGYAFSPVPYDSRVDTREHIQKVHGYLLDSAGIIANRGEIHDASKLVDPEKSAFDVLTPKLKEMAYGSEEYRACLREMKPALAHHYASNSHHPEHFNNGVSGMSLFDVVEMLMDWKAATERMKDGGDIYKSINYNAGRFAITPQLSQVLWNTAYEMGWENKNSVQFSPEPPVVGN